jgi:[citrate (pro-3S)-lyase] ligase
MKNVEWRTKKAACVAFGILHSAFCICMIPVAAPLLTDAERLDARRLIESKGLAFEEGCDEMVGIYDDSSPAGELANGRTGGLRNQASRASRLVATAGRAGYVLKMFAVDEAWQGGDVLGALASELVARGRAAGHDAFLVFTRPEHVPSFQHCQFRLLVTTGEVALLECGGGLERYLEEHRRLRREGANGAVVINGNPFTRGHQFLVETAAAQVDALYVFIVSEDRSVFPFAVRRRLAAESIRHVRNAVLLDTSRYAVSAATFPSYFLRRHDEKARLQMEVDLRLFATRIAPAFAVTRRFVGTEPYCETTAAYNRAMAAILPSCGVGLVEVPRATDGDRAISATTVRQALAVGDMAALERLVPPATLAFLVSPEGRAIARRLQEQDSA